MSDPNVSTTGESTITVEPGKPAPAAQDDKPAWLDSRLERERRTLLKELGFESIEAGKKAAADLSARLDAEKTAAQKAAELEGSLKAERAQREAMASALGVHAKAQMAGLSETQRSAVAAVAGDDPAKQLTTIEALRPTWASVAAPAAPAPVVAKDTAPAPAAPKDGGQLAPPDPKAIHAELKKTNPVLAARYALLNGVFDNG